jgi:hypothetical protein
VIRSDRIGSSFQSCRHGGVQLSQTHYLGSQVPAGCQHPLEPSIETTVCWTATKLTVQPACRPAELAMVESYCSAGCCSDPAQKSKPVSVGSYWKSTIVVGRIVARRIRSTRQRLASISYTPPNTNCRCPNLRRRLPSVPSSEDKSQETEVRMASGCRHR